MRKFLVIVAAALVPVGMWTAGCRQDSRQAAFPKTAEMKSLAKAAEKESPTTPPMIAAAPIDRDILNLPETPVMARINAVNDRSNQLARPKAPEGLFTLPDNGDHFAMAAPDYEIQAAPAAITPIPSAREFWSRPAAPLKRRPMDVPSDIAAMAGPAQVDPVVAPPAPYFAPMPAAPEGQFMSVEDVPGVFMGDSPISMRSGSPPARGQRFDGLINGAALGAAPSSSKRGFAEEAFASRQPSESHAPAAYIDRSIVVRSIPGDYEPLPEPIPLDVYNAALAREQGLADPFVTGVGFVAPESAKPRRSLLPIPDFMPAPPGSAKKFASAKAAAMQAPALPRESYDVPASRADQEKGPSFGSNDIRQALAPLPDISSVARTPARKTDAGKKAPPLSMPPPMPEPMPSPEMTAAKNSLINLEALDGDDDAPGATDRDFFRTDFWERKSPGAKPDFDLELPEPKSVAKPMAMPTNRAARPAQVTTAKKPPAKAAPAKKAVKREEEEFAKLTPETPMWVDDLPETTAAINPVLLETTQEKEKPAGAKPAAPQKVKLQPMRKARESELGHIDSATEVPPLRF